MPVEIFDTDILREGNAVFRTTLDDVVILVTEGTTLISSDGDGMGISTVFSNGNSSDRINIQNGGSLRSISDNIAFGVTIAGTEGALINEATGTISASAPVGSVGVFLGSTDGTFVNMGAVYGAIAVEVEVGAFITNPGTLASTTESNSTDAAIFINDFVTGNTTINNSGDILGGASGRAIFQDGANLASNHQQVIVDNSGLIDGTIILGRLNDRIANSGLITDGILTNDGNDRVENTGTIIGNISMGDGIDRVSNSGTIEGSVLFGLGEASLNNSGTIMGIALFDDDGAVLINSGLIQSGVRAFGGVDRVVNHGTMEGTFELFARSDVAPLEFINSGTITSDTVLLWTGDATVQNSGVISGQIQAVFDNIITNTSTGSIGSLSLGNGDDIIRNAGDILESVSLGGGINRLVNTGQVLGEIVEGGQSSTIINRGFMAETVTFGPGNDSFVNSGTSGAVNSLAGTFSLVNSGTIDGFVLVSFGIAFLTNSGTIEGSIGLDGGDDFVSNSGTVTGVVSLRDGNDTYRAIGDGVADSITGGTGDDKIIGGTSDDIILGEDDNDLLRGQTGNDDLSGGAGSDTILGGAGDDTLTGGTGIDTMNGGAGSDTFVFEEGDFGAGASRDRIFGFDVGEDVIDLTGEGLTFGGSSAIGGGQASVWTFETPFGTTLLRVDFDGNGSVDGVILLSGTIGVTSDDILL